MNIFVTDSDPVVSAQNLDDKRVTKMLLESAQILCSALSNLNSWSSNLYRPTHTRHPSVLWAGRSRGNFDWLGRHGLALGAEFRTRFGHHHKSVLTLHDAILAFSRCPLDTMGMTPFENLTTFPKLQVQLAYQEYLVWKWTEVDKKMPRWTNRQEPSWFSVRMAA